MLLRVLELDGEIEKVLSGFHSMSISFLLRFIRSLDSALIIGILKLDLVPNRRTNALVRKSASVVLVRRNRANETDGGLGSRRVVQKAIQRNSTRGIRSGRKPRGEIATRRLRIQTRNHRKNANASL